MLTLKSIEMASNYKHGFGEGATPGLACKVEFQVGDKCYDKIKVDLPPEAVKRVASAIVAEAMALLQCEVTEIDVEGSPGHPSQAPVRSEVEPI